MVGENASTSLEKQLMIVKSNELIEACYAANATTQKTMAFCFSLVDNRKEDFEKITFKMADFLELLGEDLNDINKNHAYYKKAIDNLLSTKIYFTSEEKEYYGINCISDVVYSQNKGKVTVTFNPLFKRFALQLKNNFTRYEIENVVRLQSRYSIRFYELLKQYERIGQRTLTLADIRLMFMLPPGMYPQYGMFKKKIINYAISEINDKTDLDVRFNEIKTGRSVSGLEFIIRNKSNKKGDALDESLLEGEDDIKAWTEVVGAAKYILNQHYGTREHYYTEEEIKSLVTCAKADIEMLKEAYDIMLTNIGNGTKVQNEPAYLKKLIIIKRQEEEQGE